jgi:hypothetical protein
MTIALPIAFATFPGSTSLYADFIGELVDDGREIGMIVKRANAALDRVEQEMEAPRTGLRSAIESAKRLVGLIPESEFDRLIDHFEQAEARMRDDDVKMDRLVAKVEKMVKRHRPALAARLGPLIARYNDQGDRMKAEMRDTRWALMTIRSEQRRGETGSDFTDPDDLARYLTAARH